MLDTPAYGWSCISIKDWSDRCSYIDDVPFMVLEAIDKTIRTGKSCAVEFDAEGYFYIVVFHDIETYVITEDRELLRFDVGVRELASECIADIRRDMEAWAKFVDYGDMTEDQYLNRVADLQVLCEIMEKRI